jgi:hypothetical protein
MARSLTACDSFNFSTQKLRGSNWMTMAAAAAAVRSDLWCQDDHRQQQQEEAATAAASVWRGQMAVRVHHPTVELEVVVG